MKDQKKRWPRFLGCVLFVLPLVGVLCQKSSAQSYTLNNLNSIVQINASSPAGMSSYLVDGVDFVKQQWFYYRIGDSGPNHSIDFLGNLYVAPRTDPARLDLTYSDSPSSPNYQVRLQYTLTGQGAGSGQSQLGETVTFYNTSTASLNVRFFDYSDFDLARDMNDDSVTLSRTTLGLSYRTSFLQTLGPFSVNSSAISGRNNSTHLEANYFENTLDNLLNGSPTSLNDTLTATAGDLTAAIEWDLALAPGSSLQISKVIQLVVPEPSSAALLGLGLVAWMVARRNSAKLRSGGDRTVNE